MIYTRLQRIATLTGLFLVFSVHAQDSDICRENIVQAQRSVGVTMEVDSFSSTSFEQLNIDVEQYNQLSSEEQELIYMQVKPISVMAEETINTLNRIITRYVGTASELFVTDELERWRTFRDTLRTHCL